MPRYLKKIQEGTNARLPSGTGMHLWLVLWRAHDAMREYASRNIQCLGIGLSDFAVLEVLLHRGPTPVNAIGSRVRLTSGSISVAIDRLEQRRLVKRRLDAEDRRTRMVHLTSAGRKLIEGAFQEHANAIENLAAVLSREEQASCAEMLKKLGKAAAAAVANAGEGPA